MLIMHKSLQFRSIRFGSTAKCRELAGVWRFCRESGRLIPDTHVLWSHSPPSLSFACTCARVCMQTTLGHTQWCWYMFDHWLSRDKRPWFVMFAHFRGVNTVTTAHFKLPRHTGTRLVAAAPAETSPYLQRPPFPGRASPLFLGRAPASPPHPPWRQWGQLLGLILGEGRKTQPPAARLPRPDVLTLPGTACCLWNNLISVP